MRIGITGASGYVGQFLVRHFLRQGYEVRALLRREESAALFRSIASPRLAWSVGDITSDTTLQTFVSNLDVVVHAAFEHLPGRYRNGEGEDLEGFLHVNLNQTLALIRYAYAAKVKKFVFISSRAVYATGKLSGSLSEEQVVQPDTFYGGYKAAVEAMLSAWAYQRGWHAVSLRLTGVYGLVSPLSRSKWYDIARAVISGEAYLNSRLSTEVHGEDVARAVELLLEHEDARGRAVNCSDCQVSSRELVKILRSISGQQGPLPPQPQVKPPAVMDCAYLQGKGFQFGGVQRLRETLEELVEAVQQQQSLIQNAGS
ncbi:NAD-dependent epimerase/dehydratase family protein [Microbulbifer sp. EKSA005]|uniref:NAD-dependent epimerase/dehydratase family protein n=1 Tax=Microbulbifer sp. EKSA005 TaxID=3243364 RepID=UPI0040424EC3